VPSGLAAAATMQEVEQEETQPELNASSALILVMTAHQTSHAQDASLRQRGVHGVLQKPLTMPELRCATGMIWGV
jgi:hypothetical protein